MTRKHFKSIADAVRATVKECYMNDATLNDAQVELLISNLADACKQHNPNFKRDTFREACRS